MCKLQRSYPSVTSNRYLDESGPGTLVLGADACSFILGGDRHIGKRMRKMRGMICQNSIERSDNEQFEGDGKNCDKYMEEFDAPNLEMDRSRWLCPIVAKEGQANHAG